MSQLELIPRKRGELRIEAARTEPRLWLERLTIWKSPEEKVRVVSFRRGLNIVWAPDRAEETAESGTRRAGGHDAGKSLLCRLIRFCLGEKKPGDAVFRQRLANAWRDSMVGLEARLDGQPWAILRSMSMERHHRAVRGGSLEALLHDESADGTFDRWLEALEACVITRPLARLFPGYEQAPEAWLLALAWMSRDQECRFTHPLEWRNAGSQSESPARARDLDKADFTSIVRLLMGAGDAEERDAGLALEKSEGEKKKAEERRARVDVYLELALEQSARRHDEEPSTFASAEFALEALRKRLIALKEPLRLRAVSREEKRLIEVNERLLAQREQIEELKKVLGQLAGQIEAKRQQYEVQKETLPELFREDLLSDDPICTLCKVPISRVKVEGCRFSDELPDFPTLKRLHDKYLTGLRALEADIEALTANTRVKEEELADLKALRTSLEIERAQLEELIRRIEIPPEVVARLQLESELRLIEQAWKEQQGAVESVRDATGRVNRARGRKTELQARHRETLRRFENHYDQAVAAIVGSSARGEMSLGDKGFELRIRMGDEKTSVTFSSLKVLAFDLAALLMSIEDRAKLPGLLIHDCPRESDMGDSLYHRLFTSLAKLQEGFGEEVPFQYIITTTSAPPPEYQDEPWIVLKLNALNPKERLLGEALNG